MVFLELVVAIDHVRSTVCYSVTSQIGTLPVERSQLHHDNSHHSIFYFPEPAATLPYKSIGSI
jgi:hypothetical protein